MRRDFHFDKVKMQNNTMLFEYDPERFEKNFGRAQYLLDSQVMTDMVKFMPMITGTFINETKALSASVAGSGYVYAAAPPYGRFLYYGKTMVAPSGSTYAKLGQKKVLVSEFRGKTNAKENLTYTKSFHPNVVPEWYTEAKKRYGHSWIGTAKKEAGRE